MAGSFDHCDDDGTFRFELIENMGDAYEACEEMHFMIWYLARALSTENPRAAIDAAEREFHRKED